MTIEYEEGAGSNEGPAFFFVASSIFDIDEADSRMYQQKNDKKKQSTALL